MADDVRIKITGDARDLKKEYKKLDKLLDRFDKVNKRSSQRRAKQAKTTSKTIERITAAEVRKTMAIRRRAQRLVAQDQKRREREAIRSEKREARARERILKRHAARRRRLLRGVGGFFGRAAGLLGIGGGAGLIYAAREILNYDVVIARVAAQAEVTKQKQLELRDSINAASLAYGVNRNVLADTVRRIVDKSGEFGVAANNVDKLAKVLRGTGVDAAEFGELVAALAAQFKGAPIFDFLEVMIAQGDKGVINLQEMSGEAEKLIGAFSRAGLQGKKAFIEFGALTQIAGLGGGKAEAATFMSQFLQQVRKQAPKLEKAFPGVKLLGERGELLGVRNTIEQLLRVSGGNLRIIQKLIPNIRGVAPLELIAQPGKLEEAIAQIERGEKAAGNIQRKFDRVADTASQGFERVAAGMTIFTDKVLVDVLNDMADSMQKMLDDPEAMKQLGQTARDLAALLRIAAKVGGFAIRTTAKAARVDVGVPEPVKEARKSMKSELLAAGRPESELSPLQARLTKFFGGGGGRATQKTDNVTVGVTVNNQTDVFGQKETTVDINTQQNADRGESRNQ